MTNADALKNAIDAENAAIFTYGVTTAFIGPAERGTVAEFIADHRIRRNELNDDLTAAGGGTEPPAPGYDLPTPVTDPKSSATVLLAAEEDCARAYRAMLEQVDDAGLRRRAVDALTSSAKRSAHWRGVLGQSPATVPFPGQPS
ncbi:MAG: ferritin-like domain-containing protein [Gordonia sp. (in: high G+C Gram-positive bacteria)]|uniref:ferritin-like domain-containing protein n=1 Tax=Gordonia sp. (in: high G+C Gram-positive bacteria) TaxID=84139 RepID=UPI0039E55655